MGDYLSGGGGGRLRWEPFDLLGFELYAEYNRVHDVTAIRQDFANGFNLYVPINLGEKTRLLPKIGICDVIAFVDPDSAHTKALRDVLLGAHLGLGIEHAVSDQISLFADLIGYAYFGHKQVAGGWSSSLTGDFAASYIAQVAAGVTAHF